MGVQEGELAKRHRTDDRSDAPRAIIHKQILDQAEERPGASMETIADAVSGATTTTVERVLEEYGDPAVDEDADGDAESVKSRPDGGSSAADASALSDEGATAPAATAAARSDEQSTTDDPSHSNEPTPTAEQSTESELDRSSLTEKQYETLRAIHRDPDATQAELADKLGVSSPTISQRVNSIDGFDWSNRHALVDPLFDADTLEDEDSETDVQRTRAADDADSEAAPSSSSESDDQGTDSHAECVEAELVDQLDDLARQVATLERELSSLASAEPARPSPSVPSVLSDPELAHKVVHACIHSDRITEDEELRLIRAVTATGSTDRSEDASVDRH